MGIAGLSEAILTVMIRLLAYRRARARARPIFLLFAKLCNFRGESRERGPRSHRLLISSSGTNHRAADGPG